MDTKIIGKRIKYFRNRAGINQLNLELDIGAANGSLSRIENGEVNPTKETLYKIADYLDLTNQERQYLYGAWFEPAAIEEVNNALDDVKDYFNKRGVLAYVLDERFRFICISKSFQKLLNFKDSEVKNCFLEPFTSLFINDKYNLQARFPNEVL